MTFTAQELQHRITIESQVTTQDPMTGEIVTTWQTFAQPFAKVEPLVGRELFAAQQVLAAAPVKFTMRYLPDLDASMRIRWQGAPYNITSIANVKGRNRETLIYATAGVNTG